MKYIIVFTLIVFANDSSALVIWPGTSAPCNTTLDACADGSPYGETIEIRTNGPINESVSASGGISLVAGIGYKPVFTAGNVLNLEGTSQGDLEVTISGLTLTSGRISYIARNAPGEVTKLNIINNHIIENSVANNAIRVNNLGADNTLDLNIIYNQINYTNGGSSIAGYGAISINNGLNANNPSSSEITGRVYNNQIESMGTASVGIGLYGISDSSFDLDISSNTLIGGGTAGVYIEKSSESTGSSHIDFAHNASYSNQIDANHRGIMAEVAAGELEINAINNTIINAFDGFNFQETGSGQLDVKLYNNIVAFSGAPVILNFYNLSDSTIDLTNDNNLFYDNELDDPDYMPGPNFIDDNPQIKSLTNARLRPGSPAIEAGNLGSGFYTIGVPNIDADGLYRLKNGNPGSGGIAIDIGAYEAGDVRILDTLNGNPSRFNPIESTAINAEAFAKVQITQNFNPNGIGIFGGIDNDINIGVYRDNAIWTIFSQDEVSQMDTNVAFNIWNPAPSTRNFVHTADDAISASESFTEIDRSGLNDNPDAILSVTPLWEGIYNDNPVGIFYSPFTNRWNIYNSNLADMPLNAKFNVYFQAESANAFMHRTSNANISADASYIDHPLLNGTPCAQFQITYDSGIVFDEKVGVFYNSGVDKWGVFTQSHDPMPVGARFHVIISAEQIEACNNDLIFADGFE